MKFTYSSGQRPLDGYTLKRGIGKGGFGEVYYGVSDGGKEVALKLVRGNQPEVELRGVAQCLNLKHPNLVALYDLKTDRQGDRWVIMEYVAGEALNCVLARHPNGLPAELAQQWFLALARAVGYLHDHGIVHRDLKPGNIFLENGTVKVGDYGLSKFIGCSQRTAQTQSVGTVHYMAPEISTGNYNKQVDIYAAGIILYEMLTGRVPFEGESAGEILMKHLTTPPDLTRLPREYVPVVAKALAKNPAHRYSTMAEMARAVEALGGVAKAEPAPAAAPAPRPKPVQPVLDVLPVNPTPNRLGELSGSLALTVLFAAVATGLVTALTAAFGGRHELSDYGELNKIGTLFFLTVISCWAVLVPAKLWGSSRGDSWVRRIVMMVIGAGVGILALWLQGWVPGLPGDPTQPAPLSSMMSGQEGVAGAAGCLSYFALAFFAVRWWKMADRRRPHRFSFGPLLAAGFWGCALLLIWHPQGQEWLGAAVLVLAAALIQLVSPWEPAPAAARKPRLRTV